MHPLRVTIAIAAVFILSNCRPSQASLIEIGIAPLDRIYLWEDVYDVEEGERAYYDAVVQAITVWNRATLPVRIEEVSLEALREQEVVQVRTLSAEEIGAGISFAAELYAKGEANALDTPFWRNRLLEGDVRLSSTMHLEPGSALLIPNTRMWFFTLPDRLNVRVVARRPSGQQIVRLATVQLAVYRSEIQYSFPLEGRWFVNASPGHVRDHHRYNMTTEFGVDLIKLGPDGRIWEGDYRDPGNFYGYGAKVLAAADGTVIDLHKDATDVGRSESSDPRVRAGGNYIILRHTDGEFSLYDHLREGGVHVDLDQEIRRGQHIGDVGATGDTELVHLHFQINEGPGQRYRSLPFRFADVVTRPWEPGTMMTREETSPADETRPDGIN